MHNRRPYTCFQDVWGGGEGREIDGRNIFFCFPIFSPKDEWHLLIVYVQSENFYDYIS